ncbi:hypothetical protein D3C85_1044700 [compost metagenome]
MPVLPESLEISQLLVIEELKLVFACANNESLELESILHTLITSCIDLRNIGLVLGVYRSRSWVRRQGQLPNLVYQVKDYRDPGVDDCGSVRPCSVAQDRFTDVLAGALRAATQGKRFNISKRIHHELEIKRPNRAWVGIANADYLQEPLDH